MKKLEHGDLMTIEEFAECCECKGFIDWDGNGRFCDPDGTNQEEQTIYPSEYLAGIVKTNKKHIVWFNR